MEETESILRQTKCQMPGAKEATVKAEVQRVHLRTKVLKKNYS